MHGKWIPTLATLLRDDSRGLSPDAAPRQLGSFPWHADDVMLNLVFCDVFEMQDAKIRRLTSYLMDVGA